MIQLPPKNQWVQNNKSDIFGSLWSSFNLNLTEQLGKTKVSPRMILTNNAVSRMGTPVAFRIYGGKLYALAVTSTPDSIAAWVSTNSVTAGGLKDVLTIEASSGGGTISATNDYSDMEVFNSKLFVTDSLQKLLYFNGSAWTDGGSVLTENTNHKLLSFFKLKRLYFFSSTVLVKSCDTSFTVAASGSNTFNVTTATGNADLFLVSMLQTSTAIWLLLANQSNDETVVLAWDGVTADTYLSGGAYRIPARGALAGITIQNTPYILDSNGELHYFNGGAFVPAPNGKLPVKQFKYLTNPLSLKNDRWIHPNGITLVDGRINILINNLNHDNDNTIEENLPSGIWEYDKDIGWYHKSPLSQYDYSGAALVKDFGQNRLSRVGALYNFKADDRSSAVTVGTLIAGADYYTNASATATGVFINDSLDLIQKYGYAVSAKILSTEVTTTWGRYFSIIKKLLSSTDKLWLKFRSDDSPPVEVTITWVNATSFTTTTDVTAYTQDDEVEFLQGTGSGFCSQITSVTNNAGTYTVVIVESMSNVTGTGKARFQHWKSAGTFSNQTDNIAPFAVDRASPYVQLKLCMLFTGNNEIINGILETTPGQEIK